MNMKKKQFKSIKTFKNRVKDEDLGLYDDFKTNLDFYEKLSLGIQAFIDKLTTRDDGQIEFKRIKYDEVLDYLTRQSCAANKYKEDEYWFLRDKDKEDLTKIITAKNRITLIGDAGSGKTTELKRLANYFSQDNSSLYPYYIRLNTYTDQNVDDLLPVDWNNIPEKQRLVILDGLDEIESKNKRTAIRKIEFYSEKYPSSSIIISCRNNFYKTESKQTSGTVSGFESYRLLDLSSEQINAYIEGKLFARSSHFLKEVSKKYLDPFLKIPFYLIFLVETFKDENTLPARRGDIFEKLLAARMKLDESHFKNTKDFIEQKEEIIRNLEKVALGMECLGRNYLLDGEHKQLVPDRQIRDTLKYCTAWKKVESENIRWQFDHNNIQEYLAASLLSKQPITVIKDFIAFKPDYKKVIPSWVNTVSFLLSVSAEEELIDWVLEIEPEICLKFEADKISKDKKIDIFKNIFNEYKEKKIRINNDRIRDDELARFAQSDEAIKFLIDEIKEASHVTTVGNAMEIITEMDIPIPFKQEVQNLLELIAAGEFSIPISDSIQSKALIGLSRLNLNSKEVIENVVSKLRYSKSDWVRYGLYYLLHESNFLDDYIDIFLEGIPYVVMDFSSREDSRLFNERWELKEGLKKVKKPDSIKKLINHFMDEERHVRELFIGDHDISFLAELLAKAFSEDPSVLDQAVSFSLSLLYHHDNQESEQFFSFYEKTDTKFNAFQLAMKKESYHRETLMADLADSECIDYFICEYEKGNLSDDLVWGVSTFFTLEE